MLNKIKDTGIILIILIIISFLKVANIVGLVTVTVTSSTYQTEWFSGQEIMEDKSKQLYLGNIIELGPWSVGYT